MFLRQLFGELEGTDHCSVVVRDDNQAGIAIAKNPVFQSRAKHIDVCYHFFSLEAVINKQIVLQYCSSKNNVAEIFTEKLTQIRFGELCRKLGLYQFV